MNITIEGIDGSGKSSLASALLPRIEPAIIVHELTATETGNKVHDWILRHDITSTKEIAVQSFKKLLEARISALEIVAKGMLEGKNILRDRYVITTMAYQAFKAEWGMKEFILSHLKKLSEIPAARVDATILLSVSPDIVIERLARRASSSKYRPDVNDQKSIQYYLELTDRMFHALGEVPEALVGKILIIDGNTHIEQVVNEVYKQLKELSLC